MQSAAVKFPLYFSSPRNFYDMLAVMPNFGRGSRISTVYPGIQTDTRNYYLVNAYVPDIGLHYVKGVEKDPKAISLSRFTYGVHDKLKGMNPEWLACLPWKTVKFAPETSAEEDSISWLTEGKSWNELFDEIKFTAS
jgi:hypothetical protein